MTEQLAFNPEALFAEIVEAAIAEGIVQKDAYDEFVESYVFAYEAIGELHDDQDLESIVVNLQERFTEYQQSLTNRSDG